MIDKDLQVHNDHQDMMVVVETAKEVTIPSEQNRHNCWAIKSRERCEVSHHQKMAQTRGRACLWASDVSIVMRYNELYANSDAVR